MRWTLVGFVLATPLAGAVIAHPDGPLITAALVALLVAAMLPFRALVFAWAALLPIWSVGPLDPILFDAARLGGAVLILLRARPGPGWYRRELNGWGIPLSAVALLLTAYGAIRSDETTLALGVTMFAAVVVGWLALARLRDLWPVLAGFTAGATLSALVLVAAAFGWDALVANTNAGFDRATGLGTSAPRVSFEFAVAIITCWAAHAGRLHRLAVTCAGSLCLVALLLSGGRVGLAGLLAAALLALVLGWVRPAPALAAVATVGLALWQLPRFDVALNTLDRLAVDPGQPFATGRIESAQDAVRVALEHPWQGAGLDAYVSTHGGVTPHVAPLMFAVAGGIGAFGVIAWLTVRLAGLVIRRTGGTPLERAARLVAVALLVTAALEPLGPFVGVEMVTLLLVVVAARDGRSDGDLRPLVGVGSVLPTHVHLVRDTRRTLDVHQLAAKAHGGRG